MDLQNHDSPQTLHESLLQHEFIGESTQTLYEQLGHLGLGFFKFLVHFLPQLGLLNLKLDLEEFLKFLIGTKELILIGLDESSLGALQTLKHLDRSLFLFVDLLGCGHARIDLLGHVHITLLLLLHIK